MKFIRKKVAAAIKPVQSSNNLGAIGKTSALIDAFRSTIIDGLLSNNDFDVICSNFAPQGIIGVTTQKRNAKNYSSETAMQNFIEHAFTLFREDPARQLHQLVTSLLRYEASLCPIQFLGQSSLAKTALLFECQQQGLGQNLYKNFKKKREDLLLDLKIPAMLQDHFQRNILPLISQYDGYKLNPSAYVTSHFLRNILIPIVTNDITAQAASKDVMRDLTDIETTMRRNMRQYDRRIYQHLSGERGLSSSPPRALTQVPLFAKHAEPMIILQATPKQTTWQKLKNHSLTISLSLLSTVIIVFQARIPLVMLGALSVLTGFIIERKVYAPPTAEETKLLDIRPSPSPKSPLKIIAPPLTKEEKQLAILAEHACNGARADIPGYLSTAREQEAFKMEWIARVKPTIQARNAELAK